MKLLPRAVLAIASTILTLGLVLLAGEAYFRFIYDGSDSFNLSLVSQRWFDRHYHFNSIGMRDEGPYPLALTQGLPRVTFVGDSFTVGHGIADPDDRFVNLLRSQKRDSWEVHMLAQNGLDTRGETLYIKEALRQGYRFQFVVLVYCLNDIQENVPEWGSIVKRIYATSQSLPWILRSSYFLNWLYIRLVASRDPAVSNYFGMLSDAYAGPAWEAEKRNLAELFSTVRQAHAQPLVVIFPFVQLLDRYPFEAAHARLRVFSARQGVPVLDLLEMYRSHAGEKLAVNRFDGHPNRRAHALAAEAMRPFIDNVISVNRSSRR